jgi:hypothetical protein
MVCAPAAGAGLDVETAGTGIGAHCVLSLLIEPSGYVVDGILVESSIQTLCTICDMWCAEHIVQRAIWMIRRQRFDIKDVQSRTGDLSRL